MAEKAPVSAAARPIAGALLELLVRQLHSYISRRSYNMCQASRQHVLKLLEEHTISVRKITQLRYELEHETADSRRKDILVKLAPLEREADRLETYLRLLPAQQEVLLRRRYFDGATWSALCNELGLSPKTVRKFRRQAVDTLADMYEFAEILA